MNTIGIVGTGTMGAGLMQVAALAGYTVIGVDSREEALASGRKEIERMLKIAQRKPFPGQQPITKEQADAAVARIQTSTALDALASCDLVIEAIIEDHDAKAGLLQKLDAACKPETILATNTSSLNVTKIAQATNRPARVLGLHFFNPVPLMELVEIVRTDVVDDAVVAAAREFCEKIGKKPILAADTPAFIVNFLLMPFLLGAARMWEQGQVTPQDIDTGMKLGCGHPKGPLELLDTIGIDVALKVADTVAAVYPDKAEYQAPQVLRDMQKAGKLGRKTKGGIYDYGAGAYTR